MSGIRRVFRFEWKRLVHNKLALLLPALLTAAVLLGAAFYYMFFIPTNTPYAPNTREAILTQYGAELADYEHALIHNSRLTKSEKRIIEDMCMRLRFYIFTETIESDYIQAGHLTEKRENSEGTGFMFLLLTVAGFFMWALAVAAALYLFVFEYHTQTLKNILAAKIDRKKLFLSRLLLLMLFITAVFLLFIAVALPFGMQETLLVPCRFELEYRAVSVAAVFAAQAAATYVLMAVLAAVSVLAGIAFKNLIVGICTPGTLYGLCLLMYFSVIDLRRQNPSFDAGSFVDNIPIISLQLHIGGFDMGFVLSAALHLLGAGLLFYFASLLFRKRDI